MKVEKGKLVKIKSADGSPLLIDPDWIEAITVHGEDSFGNHKNCGTLYMKGETSACFHVANAADLIERFSTEER